ncbi:MAG: iron ABC transporter permease [Oscillospiraceae bacterium]|nr:iron ABC transporter permease [Oscillospiraceae bacterium]
MKITKGIIIAIASIAASLAVIILGIAAGSVFVPLIHIIRIIGNMLFGTDPEGIPETYVSIIREIRFPRVLLGFLTGAALSVCGTTVQSVLKNPLASPFTLGVSSGASLGAGIVIAGELTFLGSFTLPAAGLIFGIGTMFLMVAFASKIDRTLQGSTIVLTGMVLSLFINGIVSVMANAKNEKYKQIMKWQTGSFSGRKWDYTAILAIVFVVCFIFMLTKARDMDLLTFGDEQAKGVGLNVKAAKISLLIAAAVLSGTAVSFAGVIGFVDLVAPHIARRIFGAKHKLLLPMSAVIGGIFMVLCDLAARTVITPNELPVGAVTSLIGAPFFTWVFFKRRKDKS